MPKLKQRRTPTEIEKYDELSEVFKAAYLDLAQIGEFLGYKRDAVVEWVEELPKQRLNGNKIKISKWDVAAKLARDVV